MSESCEICALVSAPGDARELREAGATRIYLDVIDREPTEGLADEVRRGLVVPVLDEVCREGDHARLDPWVMEGRPVAVGNVSELALARERGALAEARGCIPAHNAAALRALDVMGACLAWLSPELSLGQMCRLARAGALPVGACVFGRPRLMTCEHCALQVAYACDRDHANCPYRYKSHWLVNIDERALPVRTDGRGRSRVYLDEPVDLVPEALELARAGVGRLLFDARNVPLEQAARGVGRCVRALAGEAVEREGCVGLSERGVE